LRIAQLSQLLRQQQRLQRVGRVVPKVDTEGDR
jgi:hypothetical protein